MATHVEPAAPGAQSACGPSEARSRRARASGGGAPRALNNDESGFSLVETLIAMAILATGLLSLAGVFIMGLAQLSGSTASLIAREKAREAVESVHTARDTKTIAWCQIRNFGTPTNCPNGASGAFLSGEQQLRTAGDDGLVNTGDDGDIEVAVSPGYDGVMGTSDDRQTPLDNYRREIQITDIIMPNGLPNPNLRQLRVIISYRVGPSLRSYTLTTYISAIS